MEVCKLGRHRTWIEALFGVPGLDGDRRISMEEGSYRIRVLYEATVGYKIIYRKCRRLDAVLYPIQTPLPFFFLCVEYLTSLLFFTALFFLELES